MVSLHVLRIDYTVVSSTLFSLFVKFEILLSDEYTHLPQSFMMSCNFVDNSAPPCRNDFASSPRNMFKWTDQSFDKLASDHMNVLITTFYSKIESGNVNDATRILSESLQYVCSKTNRKKQKENLSRSRNNPWWDDELEELRKHKHLRLRILHSESSELAITQYHNIRNKFKRVLRQKKMLYKLTIRNKIESCKSAAEFWNEIHFLKDNKACVNNITVNMWYDYFSNLFNMPCVVDEEYSEQVHDFINRHNDSCAECAANMNMGMNRNITISEIEDVISKLDNGKAPGLDGITYDCLKKCKIVIVPLLCQLFNKILDEGVFPDSWCEALIVPVHKSGSADDPSNYRGISLLSCISKVLTKILNNRLVTWAEENDKMYDEQAGFRKGKGTLDQIFILQSLISKYLCRKGGRCYNVFIDFSKAFDTVPHMHMFYRMIREGMHGKIITTLQNMYSKLKSCIEVNRTCVSDSFDCTIGTRQGCMISPFCFIFYLNELISMCKTNLCQGIYVNEYFKDINMLLYADDIVLIGDKIGHVQRLLNLLKDYCNKWGLKVNMLKTKMLVYRNGGIVKRNERCYFDGNEIEVVKYYKYLGVLFSSRLSWSPAQALLAAQGSKAMFLIDKLNYTYDFPYHASRKLFDKCIIPVLTYGSQIWGTRVNATIENVKLKFCKRQLGVGTTTPSVAVLGECGTFPIFIQCFINVLKYWFKLVNLPNDSLLRSCYDMLCVHVAAGRENWAGDVKSILYRHGFGYVWEQQNIDDIHSFIELFTQRLCDSYVQNWNSDRNEMPKLSLYNLFKLNFETEPYLLFNIPRRLRKYLAKFRTSSTSLEIEIGRHNGILRENRLCKLCLKNNVYKVEDEFHMLLECPVYSELRKIYLGQIELSLFVFCSILKSNQPVLLISLANYICSAFEIRSQKLDEQ